MADNRGQDEGGCGCFSILVAGAVIWVVVALFTDYRIGCCGAIILAAAVALVLKLLGKR